MRKRFLIAVLSVAAIALVIPLEAPAQAKPRVRDSVVGSGTVELIVTGLPEPVVTAFEIDVRSKPNGKKATGLVSFDAFFADAEITCLDVRTFGTSPPFDEATMNVATDELGLITLQVSDGNPEGLPDFISAVAPSQRSPSDCSRLTFGSENVRGFVVSGDVDLVNADGSG